MAIVIREQDILKKEPPHAVGFWDENSIRSYQESYGINYGASVFVRGSAPNREWSNDRTFNGDDGASHVAGSAPEQPVVKSGEVDDLKAEIQSLKDLIRSMAAKPSMAVKPEVAPLGDPEPRHGKPLDKRTREYKDAKKAA